MEYRYYSHRPPMPGAQPRMGLVDTTEYDQQRHIYGFGRVYAVLVYDRQLTDSEVSDFELLPDADASRPEIHYKGFTIRYNPHLGIWDVWDNSVFIASTGTADEAKTGIDNL